MKVLLGLALAISLLPCPSASAKTGELSYYIDATLDEHEKLLRGHQMVQMSNWSQVPLDRLFFHLFPNALGAVETADLRQLSQGLEAFEDPLRAFPRGEGGGSVKIHCVLIDGRPAEYTIQRTWMVVLLTQPLSPGGCISVEIEFCLKIPRFNSYLGHWKKVTTMAKWYPQLAFLMSDGWLYREEVELQESLANFADYWLRLRLPHEMVVAATGYLVKARREGQVSVQNWSARHVRDFGWVASNDFQVCTQSAPGVSVSSFFLPGHRKEGVLAATHARRALVFYGARLGSYPRRHYAVVETHLSLAAFSLPGLCLVSRSLYQLGERSDLLEATIAHEVAHQWWGEMVDAREPWFSEGFARFWEFAFMRAHHGTEGWLLKGEFLGLSWVFVPLRDMNHSLYANLARLEMEDRMTLMASQFRESLSYQGAVYAKAPLVLEVLSHLLGNDAFLALCRGLLAVSDHHVITSDDLKQAAHTVAGRDLGWFFHQWLETTSRCDYSIARMRYRQMDPGYETRLRLVRRGDAVMPVEIAVTFDDGSRLRQRWDGRARDHEAIFVSSMPPRAAQLSGAYQRLVHRFFNNSHPRKTKLRILLWPLPRVASEMNDWKLFPRVYLDSQGKMDVSLTLRNRDMFLMSGPFLFQRDSQFRGEVRCAGHQGRWIWSAEWTKRIPFLGIRTVAEASWSQGEERRSLEGTVRWIGGRFLCRTPYHIMKLRGRYEKARGREGHFSLSLELRWDGRRTIFFPTFGNIYLLKYQRHLGSWSGGDSRHRLSLEWWHHRLVFGRIISVLRLFGGLLVGSAATENRFDLGRDAHLYGLRGQRIRGDACLGIWQELRWPVRGSTALAWSARWGLVCSRGSTTVAAQELAVGLRLLGNSPLAIQMHLPIFTRYLSREDAPRYMGWSFRWGAQPKGL